MFYPNQRRFVKIISVLIVTQTQKLGYLILIFYIFVYYLKGMNWYLSSTLSFKNSKTHFKLQLIFFHFLKK